ncbi:6-pyruvoyl tetrahydropterin synthase [Kosmotoga arenicorallina S304]|uniref:6-carboxy-5,6,7,8-tetrahydropterin synthase n=1 Tax=Kosmotoga arenicorallina S304 TaxID=1453497 RepID=A0A176K069_9BACT|nr:6-carboxytetrahydropterin synthase QueD [Kosmotoga arenicorallina]OAA30033.1 6-pyruvoyl tetrahydropterin synthase [Kosmotoga arenicorallina S304]
MYYVTKEFSFDAAHNLIRYHGKCEKLHGHTYKLRVTVAGKPDSEGMVIDFIELKEVVRNEILRHLDHSYINEIIEQPTAENIAKWIFDRLKHLINDEHRKLHEITLWETPTSFVRYLEEE